jgi:serine/threonine protein phosphatase PrpC
MRPSQQQSIHPSQQQSIHPSQQQSMRPSQQQSIHPSQQLNMQAQNQSMKNQSINSQKQQGSIRPGSQMGSQQNGSKNPSVKISRKSSIRTSRNKSPPLVVRGKDGQIKASGSDFNGNNYYINCDEENNTPDIATHLSEYLKNEISIHSSRIDIPKNNKPGNGFRFYGQLTKAGRNQNGKTKIDQDTPLVHLNVGDIPGFNLFGVLDGHGPDGHYVSRFCRDYFIKRMIGYADYCKQKGIKTPEAIYEELKKTKFAYIIDTFQQADTELSKQKFDFHFSGTTCNIAFQLNKYLISANVGDSRSILVFDKGDSKNQGILPLSRDHKPDLPGEINRILSHGGAVDKIADSEGNKVGPLRVWKAGQNYPGLAMSRSLGDFEAKACGVISTPEIIEQVINKSCKYLVICSDGVWEFIQNEQVRDLGNTFLNKKFDVGGFCDELVKFACHSWEQFDIVRDDITVVSVFF